MVEFQVAEWLFVAENESDDRNFAEGAITRPEMAQRHHRDLIAALSCSLNSALTGIRCCEWL